MKKNNRSLFLACLLAMILLLCGITSAYAAATGGDEVIRRFDIKWVEHNSDDITISEGALAYCVTVVLSGTSDYQPGDIVITIPDHLWEDRDGNPVEANRMQMPIVEAPNPESRFAYEKIEGGYKLINQQPLSAATTASFYISFPSLQRNNYSGLALSALKIQDMKWMPPLKATLQVGALPERTSNELRARLDTKAEITQSGTYKNGNLFTYEQMQDQGRTYILDKLSDPENYVYVMWSLSAGINNSQPFSIKLKDPYLPEEIDALHPDSKASLQSELGDVNYRDFVNAVYVEDGDDQWKKTDVTGILLNYGYGSNPAEDVVCSHTFNSAQRSVYQSFYMAYPKDSFEIGTAYKFCNIATWELTESDPEIDGDPQESMQYAVAGTMVYTYGQVFPQGEIYDVKKFEGNGYDIKPIALNMLENGDPVTVPFRIEAIYNIIFNEVAHMLIQDSELEYVDINGTKLLQAGDYTFTKLQVSQNFTVPWDGDPYDPNRPSFTDGVIDRGGYPPVTFFLEKDNSGVFEPAIRITWGFNGNYNPDGSREIDIQAIKEPGYEFINLTEGNYGGYSLDLSAIPNVTGFRAKISTVFPDTVYRVMPSIELKGTGEIPQYVRDALENDATNAYIRNHVFMGTSVGEIEPVIENTSIPATEEEALARAGHYDLAACELRYVGESFYLSKAGTQTNDPEHERVALNFTVSLNKSYTGPNGQAPLSDYDKEYLLSHGYLRDEKIGRYYDLLPRDAFVDMDSISPYPNGKRLIPNFANTGRSLLVIDAGSDSISYTAYMPWLAYTQYKAKGESIPNNVWYESGINQDFNRKTSNKFSISSLQYGSLFPTLYPEDTEVMRFLNSNIGLYPNLPTYSVAQVIKQVKSDIDNAWSSGMGMGLAPTVNVHEGETYTYQLGVANTTATELSNIILFDPLETFDPANASNEGMTGDVLRAFQRDQADVQGKSNWSGAWQGRGYWRGDLLSVDVTEAVEAGIQPVIYLWKPDTIPNLEIEENRNLNNSSNWEKITVAPGQKVVPINKQYPPKCVAVDLSKTTTGGNYVLQGERSLYVHLNMRTPTDFRARAAYVHINPAGTTDAVNINWQEAYNPDNNMHAYNHLYSSYTETETQTQLSQDRWVKKGYTRVGIMPLRISVEKKWLDNDNNDGKRPTSISVKLMASLDDGQTWQPATKAAYLYPPAGGNGVTGNITITLDENTLDENGQARPWYGIFGPLRAWHQGEKKLIKYTVEEEIPDELGYTSRVSVTGTPVTDEYGNVIAGEHFEIVNTRDKETVQILVRKEWKDDQEQNRPSSIKVTIHSDRKTYAERTLSAANQWEATVINLPKYWKGDNNNAPGTPIEYWVKEEVPVNYTADSPRSYVVEDIGDPNRHEYSIIVKNTYTEKGYLDIGKYYSLNSLFKPDRAFEVNLWLKKPNGDPLTGSFAYAITKNGQPVAESVNGQQPEGTLTLGAEGMAAFYLKPDWVMRIKDLDVGTQYIVNEVPEDTYTGYVSAFNANGPSSNTGMVVAGNSDSEELHGARIDNLMRTYTYWRPQITKEVDDDRYWNPGMDWSFEGVIVQMKGERLKALNYNNLPEDFEFDPQNPSYAENWNMWNTWYENYREYIQFYRPGIKTQNNIWFLFNGADIGKEFEFLIVELPEPDFLGIRDDTAFLVNLKVTGVDENGKIKVVETVTRLEGYLSPAMDGKTIEERIALCASSVANEVKFVNKYKGVQIHGVKTWKDGGKEHDNKNEIKLTIYQDVTVTNPDTPEGYETNFPMEYPYVPQGMPPELVDEYIESSRTLVWAGNEYFIDRLPFQDRFGNPFTYTVEETLIGDEAVISEYETERSEVEVKQDEDGLQREYIINFTNTRVGTVNVTGTKTWLDGGKPHNNSTEIALSLKRVSAKENSAEEPVDAVPGWNGNTYTFSNLPKYDAEGYEYTYSVTETPVAGYAAPEYSDGDRALDDGTITNRLVGKTQLNGTKVWIDGKREHDNAAELTLTLKRVSAKEGSEEETVDAIPAWTDNAYAFTDLEKYDAEGYEYTYSVTETPVEGYAAPEYSDGDRALNDGTITNRLVGKTQLNGTKVWIDGKREHDNAAELTLTLKRVSAKEGAAEETVDAVPVWMDNAYAFTDLEKYDAEGYEYTYSVTETPVEGYAAPEYSDGDRALNDGTITNRLVGKTQLNGTKVWIDGKREHDNAAELTLTLKRVSAKEGAAEETVDAVPVWMDNAYAFTDLEKYDAEGYEYTYSVTETPVKGYAAPEYSDGDRALDNGTITNRIVGKTELKGAKVWIDGERKHDNAAELTLILKRVSAREGSEEETVDAIPSWKDNAYAYTDLDKYDAEGYEYTYSVTETPVEGYAAPVYSDGDRALDNGTIINRVVGTVKLSGTKVWVDGGKKHNNADDVQLALKRVSSKAGAVEETLEGEEPTWQEDTYTFADLTRYDVEGYEYTYYVTETQAEGYEAPIYSDTYYALDGGKITNTVTGMTEISGKKIWMDGNKPHDNAKEITLILTRKLDREGAETETLDLTPVWEGDTYTFSNLPKYDEAGYAYLYDVNEEPVAGYEKPVKNGTNFMNKIIPPTPTVTVTPQPAVTPVPNEFYFSFKKEWKGTPQEDITFTLYNPNGTVRQHRFNKRQISATEWIYEAWISTAADYYVIEAPMDGYTTVYRNVGEHRGETSRVYNGGTIINSGVPRTGDTRNTALWTGLTGASLLGMAAVALIARKKRKNGHA